jgi:hypothetical protein
VFYMLLLKSLTPPPQSPPIPFTSKDRISPSPLYINHLFGPPSLASWKEAVLVSG